jgi:hypothetical protein
MKTALYMVVAIVLLLVLAPLILLCLGACKVASDADDQSDALYDSLTQAEKKPADPEPARRAGLRIVKG